MTKAYGIRRNRHRDCLQSLTQSLILITSDIIDCTLSFGSVFENINPDLPKHQTGYALHYNLDSSHTQPLNNLLPDAPNPEIWELKFKAGKGFILTMMRRKLFVL